MNLIVRLLINALIIMGLAWALPGIGVESYWTALVVAIILGLLNIFVKPILIILTIPVTILTLGLFLFVINALIIMLAGYMIDGFSVDGFWWALLFSILMTVLNSVLEGSRRDKDTI
ncbi:phage holin family protein [Cryomorpha ignava]|uniref:Phage holin family protein n=1 Tax=Cryomorpha ignava TaxID=101383 RepID=A0A7K3WL76_9FLAO|nr:phage holin family protein [Cryomorpha ignava]NEN22393.1 phage holin family protein [Cryomorpha ignava]